MKKGIIQSCLTLSFVLVVVSLNTYLADALGVVSDYWPQNGDNEANPLRIYSGDSQSISIRLQNTDPEDAQAKVILKDGAGIALVQDKVYTVPGGTTNTEVPIEVSIPEDAEVGKKYMIMLSVDSVVGSQGDGVSFGVGYDVKIPVEVVERPVQLGPSLSAGELILYVASGVLIIIVIILLVVSRKKKR